MNTSSLGVGCLVLAVHAFSSGARAQTEQVGAYVAADVQAWAQGLPVVDFDGAWSKGYRRDLGREHRAYQSALVEGGVSIMSTRWGLPRTFSLGWIYRAEAFARMSGEAAEVAYRYQSQTDPPQAATYDAGSQTLAWRGKGVAVRLPLIASPMSDLQWSFQWLGLQRLRRTDTQGSVGYDGAQAYNYNVRLSDAHSQTASPFLPPPADQGRAMSMSLLWQGRTPDQSWAWRVRVDDVWSRLKWSGIHQESATLNSSVSTRDEQGYLNIRPVLTGKFVRQALVDRIPTTVDAQAIYQSEAHAWSLRLHRRWGIQQSWLGWHGRGSALGWRAAVEPRLGALDLGVSWAGLEVGLMLDTLSQAAQARAVSITYQWPAQINPAVRPPARSGQSPAF